MSTADPPLAPGAPIDELTQGIAELLDGFGEACVFLTNDWRIRFMNHAADTPGAERDRIIGRVLWDVVPALLGTPVEALIRKAMAERISVEAELPAVLRPGKISAIRAFPVRFGLGFSYHDVTEIRQAEARQQLLINELNHRVKNTLATIQSIANQTFRDSPGHAAAREVFVDRLLALSAAHNVLTRENWGGADLAEIAAEAVRPYDDAARSRIHMRGADARLAPQVAVGLSMALHELAANATKHGALSELGGQVSLAWRLKADGSAVCLRWRERGGPPVHPPSRRGFGARLLTRGLAIELGHPAELEYRLEGVVCTLHAPIVPA